MSFEEPINKTTPGITAAPNSRESSKKELPEIAKLTKERSEHDTKLAAMHDAIQAEKFDMTAFKERINQLLGVEELKESFPTGTKEKVLSEAEACFSLKDKTEFLEKMSKALEPITIAKKQNPKFFEDVNARLSMQEAGFILLNERMSYGISGETAHIHLAVSYEVKAQLPELFRDGIKKLAKIVKEDESIRQVIATSWLVATNTYGSMLRDVGFEIGDVPDDIKDEHFKDEQRPMKMATISREKFLELFGD